MKWNGRLPESELELMLAVWEAGEEGTTAPVSWRGWSGP